MNFNDMKSRSCHFDSVSSFCVRSIRYTSPSSLVLQSSTQPRLLLLTKRTLRIHTSLALTILRQCLLIIQHRVPNQTRKHNQGHTQTNTRNTQQPLHVLIRVHNPRPHRRTHRIQRRNRKRVSISRRRQRSIILKRQIRLQPTRQHLRPNRTRYSIPKRGANIVSG